jgi:hypothetical protein
LTPGARYRVRTHTQAGNYRWIDEEFVATFLGERYDGTEWQFSFRPLAGTGAVRRATVTSAILTNEPIRLPEQLSRVAVRRPEDGF